MIAPNLTGPERDTADMARLLAGDDGALEDLIERYRSALFRFTDRFLRDRTEAAEVVEEAFIRVYQNRQRFDFRCRFSTWLYTIAANLARNRLRCRARQPETLPLHLNEDTSDGEHGEHDELVDPIRIPDQDLQNQEWIQHLDGALAELPEKLRAPLLLVALDDLSQAEIASRFHCTVKTVEMRLFHARKQLRARLRRALKMV